MRRGRVGWLNGVVVETEQYRLILDPVPGIRVGQNVKILISHAHSDHTYGFSVAATKYATAPTRSMYQNLHQKPVRNCKELSFNTRLNLDGAEITPLNAGHMLGSAQFKIETDEQTILYTGDLNCIDTLTTLAADQTHCDLLIVEATYGDPTYVFPRRDQTYARIVQWTMDQIRSGRTPVFHVYSAGKSQELVKLFNLYTTIGVMCHPTVSKMNQIHQENGLELQYESLKNYTDTRYKPSVVITTTRRNEFTTDSASHASATGWALRIHSPRFASFPLSSHADFKQLIQFIRSTRAKTVYTFAGFTDGFASHLKTKLHVDAQPIPLLAQTKLIDY